MVRQAISSAVVIKRLLWLYMFPLLLHLGSQRVGCQKPPPLSNAQRQECLDAHNYYRRLEVHRNQASGLAHMVWDDKLENFVNTYLANCTKVHSNEKARDAAGNSRYEDIGENIIAGVASPQPLNITYKIGVWYDEGKNYGYATLDCYKGTCERYLQVVWHKSQRIGCGWSERCTSPITRRVINLFICAYGPKSDLGISIKNRPYKQNPDPCAECPTRWSSCVYSLCAKNNQPVRHDGSLEPPPNLGAAAFVAQTETKDDGGGDSDGDGDGDGGGGDEDADKDGDDTVTWILMVTLLLVIVSYGGAWYMYRRRLISSQDTPEPILGTAKGTDQ